MKSKIYCHPMGTWWAVGIHSHNPTEIKEQDYSWYNHSAYEGNLQYMSNHFAYIWTSETKIKKYYYNSSEAYYLNKYGDDKSVLPKVDRAAKLLARLRFKNMAKESFIKSQLLTNSGFSTKEINQSELQSKGFYNDEEKWKEKTVTYFSF